MSAMAIFKHREQAWSYMILNVLSETLRLENVIQQHETQALTLYVMYRYGAARILTGI